jgi:hypothetical protein
MPVNPYAPPTADAQPPLLDYFVFKSTTPLARAITIVLLLDVLADLLNVASLIIVINSGGAGMIAVAGEPNLQVSLAPHDVALGIFTLLVAIAELVLFCLFMPRANRNARWFRSPMAIAPRWAAGFFFIPIVNLWKPYQAMREIWRGSDPDPNIECSKVRVPWLLPGWWALYLIAGVCTYFIMRGSFRIKDPASYVHASWIEIVTSPISIALAAAAIGVVRGVARRQDERQARDNP